MDERQIPQDEAAERRLLSALLLLGSASTETPDGEQLAAWLIANLQPGELQRQWHRRIYTACRAAYAAAAPMSAGGYGYAAVVSRLRDSPQGLTPQEGADLVGLLQDLQHPATLAEDVRRVTECAARRGMLRLAGRLGELAYTTTDLAAGLTTIQANLAELLQRLSGSSAGYRAGHQRGGVDVPA